jgi:hypothetical protein
MGAKYNGTPDVVTVLQIVGYATFAHYLSPRDVARLARTCRPLSTETQAWWGRIPLAHSLPTLAAGARRNQNPHQVPMALFGGPCTWLSKNQRMLLRRDIVPWLCRSGALAPLQALWKKSLTLADIRNGGRNYALRRACANGHLAVVKFLLAQGLTLDDVHSGDNHIFA